MSDYFDVDGVIHAAKKVHAAQNKFWKAVEEDRAEHLFDARHNVKTLTGYEPGGPCSVFAVDRDNAEASGRRDQAAFAEPDGCDFNPKKGN